MTTIAPLPFGIALRQRKGIAVYLLPGNADWDVEIQRAPDSGGSPDTGSLTTIALVSGPTPYWVDVTPEAQDGSVYYYRARHVGALCGTPGAWSQWTRGVVATYITQPLPRPPDFNFLRIVPDPEQPDASTGRMNLHIKDAGLRLISIDYQLKEDTEDWLGPDMTNGTWFTAWDFKNGNFGQDRVIDLYQDVVLNPTHLNGIKWRWTYYDLDGETVSDTDAFLFDFDRLPNVAFGFGIFGTEAWLSWQGDEDTGAVKWLVEVNGDMPTAGELDSGGTCSAGQDSDGVMVASGLVPGDEVFLRARGYETAPCGGLQQENDFTIQVSIPADGSGTRAPIVLEDAGQSGATGTLSLTIVDPNSLVTGTDFSHKVGSGSFDSFPTVREDRSAPYNLADSIAIDPKHNSEIRWRVYYDDPDTAQEEIIGAKVVYDIDEIAQIYAPPQVTVNSSNHPVVHAAGDDDTDAIYYEATKNGTASDPTLGSPSSSGRTGSHTFSGISIDNDDWVGVKVAGWNTTNGLGPVTEAIYYREGQADPRLPIATATFSQTATWFGGNGIQVDVDGVIGSAGVGPAEVRIRYRGIWESVWNGSHGSGHVSRYNVTSGWSPWSSSPLTESIVAFIAPGVTVTPPGQAAPIPGAYWVEVQARDTGQNNLQGQARTYWSKGGGIFWEWDSKGAQAAAALATFDQTTLGGTPRASFSRGTIYDRYGFTQIVDESGIVTGLAFPSGFTLADLEGAGAGEGWEILGNRLLDNVEGGTLETGLIQDSAGNVGIRVDRDDTLPAWTIYIDLGALSSEHFIHHPALVLEADGDASFGGIVSASEFTATRADFDDSVYCGAAFSDAVVIDGPAKSIAFKTGAFPSGTEQAHLQWDAGGGVVATDALVLRSVAAGDLLLRAGSGGDVRIGSGGTIGTDDSSRAATVVASTLAASGSARDGTIWCQHS